VERLAAKPSMRIANSGFLFLRAKTEIGSNQARHKL